MRIEIMADVDIEPEAYTGLRSDLADAFGPDHFKLEGSGYGKHGIDYGFTGKGPLSAKAVREFGKAVKAYGFKVGVRKGEFTMMVFAK